MSWYMPLAFGLALFTFLGTLGSTTSNGWFFNAGVIFRSGGITFCGSGGCLKVPHMRRAEYAAYAYTTFSLLIVSFLSSACAMVAARMTFITGFSDTRRKHALIIAKVSAWIASITLLVACIVYTSFVVSKNRELIVEARRIGVFPFGYSYFIAWASLVLSTATVYALHRIKLYVYFIWTMLLMLFNKIYPMVLPRTTELESQQSYTF